MNTRMASIPLILPVETQVREMDAKLLLACVAAERGHTAYVGFQNEIRAKIASIPSGLFIAKGFASRKARFLRILRRLGFVVMAWDEEGLVHPPPDIYEKRRISAESLAMIDGVFSWGEDYTQLLKNLPIYDGTPIHEVGNPRIDLLRKDVNSYFDKDVAALRARFGSYILFNSNFGRINPAMKRRRDEGVAGPGTNSELDGKWLKGMEYRRELYQRFRILLGEVAARFPDRQVVLRPHPSERIESWNDIKDQHPNLHVLFEGNVLPWLLGAAVLIHNGCTTAIESVLMDRPAICYQPIAAKSVDWQLPNAISHVADSDAAVIAMLENHLSGSSRLMVLDSQRQQLERFATMRADRLASDCIVDVIESFGIVRAPVKWLESAAGHADARLRSMEKWLRSLLPGDIYSPWHQRKQFPDLRLDDLKEMVARLRNATGRFAEIDAKCFSKNVFAIERSA